MAYPGALPSFAGFTSSHTLAVDNHAAQHNLEQSEIVAIATKVGTGSSTPTNNTVLRGNGTGTSTWAQVGLTTDVTGVLPVANGGTGNSVGAYTPSQVDTAILAAKQALYPIGCIYTETTGTNPNVTFGFGSWSAYGTGQVLVGKASSGTFSSAGATGGAETVDISHVHQKGTNLNNVATSGGANVVGDGNNTLGMSANSTPSILQPYIVVYFWQRTA